jgi:hypothetical protein
MPKVEIVLLKSPIRPSFLFPLKIEPLERGALNMSIYPKNYGKDLPAIITIIGEIPLLEIPSRGIYIFPEPDLCRLIMSRRPLRSRIW